MLEIETKSPCADLRAVENILMEMGAKLAGRRRQIDIYLSHPLRDFASTDEALRVRKETEAASLTYKGPKIDEDTKSREELKVGISDGDALMAIFDRLGFKESGRVGKLRTIYSVSGISVCLDSVSGLGDFVELEFEGGDLDAGKKAILSMMRELGLKENERRSYLELLLDRKK